MFRLIMDRIVHVDDQRYLSTWARNKEEWPTRQPVAMGNEGGSLRAPARDVRGWTGPWLAKLPCDDEVAVE